MIRITVLDRLLLRLIHDHIEHCLEEKSDRAGQRETLKELKALSKYL